MSPAPRSGRRFSEAARIVRDSGLLPEGARVLAACSGGADSTGLLLALAELAGAGHLQVRAAHVHHGIRADQADADARRVEELGAALDVPVDVLRVDAPAARRRRRAGLEEAARALRRDALSTLAAERDCRLIALAHTRDDQAETLLLHLLRGAGPDGLAAMRPRTGPWVRPLLAVRRERVRQWLSRAGIPWASDRSNWCNGSARAMVRPLIRRASELFNESLIERLASLASLFAEDAEVLEGLAAAERGRLSRAETFDLRGGVPSRSLAAGREGLAGLPPAIARRVARGFLRELEPTGAPPSAEAVERLLRLAAEEPGSERTAHVRGRVLRREGMRVLAGGSAAGLPPPPPRPLPVPGELVWSDLGTLSARFVGPAEAAGLAAGASGGRRALLDGDRLPERLLARCRRAGDRYQPIGAVNDRSLAAWMRERDLPRAMRDRLPLVVDADADGEVLWVAGGPPRKGLAPDEKTRAVLVLDWRPPSAAGADT